MSNKYISSQKKNVNNSLAKSSSKNCLEFAEDTKSKLGKSNQSTKIADLENGNYVHSNKTENTKLRSSTQYGNQNLCNNSTNKTYSKNSEG